MWPISVVFFILLPLRRAPRRRESHTNEGTRGGVDVDAAFFILFILFPPTRVLRGIYAI